MCRYHDSECPETFESYDRKCIPKANCNDLTMNGNETRIDCGRECEACIKRRKTINANTNNEKDNTTNKRNSKRKMAMVTVTNNDWNSKL